MTEASDHRERPPIEYLHQILDLDENLGTLTWKFRADKSPQINGRWAGKRAFTAKTNGYLSGRIDGKLYFAHTVIFAMANMRWPTMIIDHIDGNTENNRPENLRDTSYTQNSMNSRLRKASTSGHIGVSFNTKRRMWEAHIGLPYQKRKKFLGYYENIDDAIFARKEAQNKYGYSERHGEKR